MNKTILITGGSRGIGRAIVMLAAQRGYKVLFTYRVQHAAAQETIAHVKKAVPDAEIYAYQLDVTQSTAVDSLCDALITEHTQIHALINNAGIVMNNPIALMSDEEWDAVIKTNLYGSFYTIRALLMHFLANKFGRIVNILSIAVFGASGQGNYAASKAGLSGLTLTLAREYGGKNINTNAVVAGLVETDMSREHTNEILRGVWEKFAPIKRLPSTEEIAYAALFLISEEAQYINGELLKVTGGLSYVP